MKLGYKFGYNFCSYCSGTFPIYTLQNSYKEIIDIPNVVLFHPDFPKDTLYKNCSIVFSIAGTASFEAACFGKPAITLVDLNYSILPSVHTLKNFDGLHDLINQLLIEKVDSKDVNRFLALFEKNVSNPLLPTII